MEDFDLGKEIGEFVNGAQNSGINLGWGNRKGRQFYSRVRRTNRILDMALTEENDSGIARIAFDNFEKHYGDMPVLFYAAASSNGINNIKLKYGRVESRFDRMSSCGPSSWQI